MTGSSTYQRFFLAVLYMGLGLWQGYVRTMGIGLDGQSLLILEDGLLLDSGQCDLGC